MRNLGDSVKILPWWCVGDLLVFLSLEFILLLNDQQQCLVRGGGACNFALGSRHLRKRRAVQFVE
jgi:hypothetical protein